MKNSPENNLPLVSVIIPCRNEEKFIGECLDSLIANDYPKDKMEILNKLYEKYLNFKS